MASARLEDLLREIRDVKGTVEKLETIVEQRLVGIATPKREEKREIRAYEGKKRRRKIKFVTLEEARKQLGIRRTSRKEGR